ncbi:gamma-glutamyltransferase [Bdellovibrio bacteriovorus]|uniref:Glutathione hydrolase proenzyme n=1 Tax=Bdellovibrio bacteriovorus TaxID=959 RepID=A0A150WPF0_BDEBC|nr:gamma-glutamyltransferase [Bdellovibrio bacteriovorus]KYG66268.1 gamma-glutamyltransferase [Bdellovibrio bacteriovorus]
MKTFKSFQIYLVSFLFITSCQSAPKAHYVRSGKERADHATAQAVGQQYAIATQGRFSSQAAEKMFAQGGNIIDAVVAASFTVSVERPQSSGIGGGGFMLFHEAKTGKTYAIDFRERAPLRATENMYLGKEGKAETGKSQNGILAVAVPGMVAGLLEIHKRFGSLPLSKVMAPAIQLAEEGFPIYEEFHAALTYRAPQILKDPAAKKIFLGANGDVPAPGSLLIQKDLAKTLRLIEKKGRNGFYNGSVAKSIVDLSKKTGGIISQKDLDDYQVKWREPVTGKYHGYEVFSMPPPSSGGVHVIQFLNFLEKDELAKSGIHSVKSIHLAASALQSSFADRATYLGDPDFTKVPVKALTDPSYIQKRRSEVPADRARKAVEVKAGDVSGYESSETTHLSLMDAEGNAVSTTQTINGWMGAGVVAPGTGVVLNNEMDDFSAQVGSSNLFGAIGGKPNSIAPSKTPLSSMSPTILMKDGKPEMVVGGPGGTRIISCVAQTILNYIEFKTSLYDAVSAVRYHHQWQPDVLLMEPPGPAPAVLEKLQKMGYEVKIQPIGCNVMATAKEGNSFRGVADPRDIGTSIAK